jgi:hypothetical protein
MYMLAIVIGTVVTAGALFFLKRPVEAVRPAAQEVVQEAAQESVVLAQA